MVTDNTATERHVPPLYIRLSSDLKDKIEVAANAKYMSISAYIRMVVSEHLEDAEKKEEGN